MAGASVQRKPTFLRQAILILLPVIVLAAVGLMSLRQDKKLAEHDAAERARVIANDLVPKILDLLAAKDSSEPSPVFEVNEAGQLLFPPPFDPVPTPEPFDFNELNAEQARLWLKVQSAEGFDARVPASREFIGSNPPKRFAAAAQYKLGALLAQQRKMSEAANAFGLVAEKYPDTRGESGLPLQTLARYKLCELSPCPVTNALGLVTIHTVGGHATNTGEPPELPALGLDYSVSVDAFCSNIVYQPTPLSPYFLNQLHQRFFSTNGSPYGYIALGTGQEFPESVTPEVQSQIQKWENVWKTHETSRQLFSAARPYLSDKALAPLLVEADHTKLMETTKQHLSELVSNRPALPLRFFWVETAQPLSHRVAGSTLPIEEEQWLVVRVEHNPTSQWFRCLSQVDAGAKVGSLVRQTKGIPDYFGVSVELAGRKLTASALDLGIWHYTQLVGSKGPGGMAKYGTGEVASTALATAATSEGGLALLKVGVHLTSPTTLYQRQRIRAGWFGLVILVSIASALIGLAAAWRAFNRQQQLNEMKSNFVSSVSHELRAPIASVRLLAESLDRGKVQEPQRQGEYYRFIVEECRRLTSLIENVLDFSRIEQGRKQYEFEPVDLVALTRETARSMEPYTAEKGVGLNVEIRGLEPLGFGAEADVDGRAIQQALINLIDNAIKHSPKGESVTIGLEEVSGVRYQVSGSGREASKSLPDTSPDTSHLTPDTFSLYVEDRGPGIPPEEHDKIFERFYRRGSELRRETQGVGIGLSIVKHIVEGHGGRVVVRSGVGQGSRFTIELPLKK